MRLTIGYQQILAKFSGGENMEDKFSNTLTMIIVVITLLLLALIAMPRQEAEAETPKVIQQMEQADACGVYVQKALEQEWERQKDLKGGE